MTTTTISASHKTQSLSSVVRDAFHIRAWLSHSDSADKTVSSGAASPRHNRPNNDPTSILLTFAGRYGARY